MTRLTICGDVPTEGIRGDSGRGYDFKGVFALGRAGDTERETMTTNQDWTHFIRKVSFSHAGRAATSHLTSWKSIHLVPRLPRHER